ncbi:hypothetical protein ANCCAN_10878 [Ancylostoma caninum]|uniref:SCP domain-containing protein n=1 Tax=Ancylostoma caninum TaxID=29170 RepID=A0A368GFI8_ANCCA|nr:hypothetical protein ANCCAN_10878 [Ancylostoma caninum]
MCSALSLVFILFCMAGPAAFFQQGPTDCGELQKVNTFEHITRVIMTKTFERKTGNKRYYDCILEAFARDKINESESVLNNTKIGKFSCPGFTHQYVKERYEMLNIFKFLMYAFGNWTEAHRDTLKNAVEYGCHYQWNVTSGKILCLFCNQFLF